MKTRKKKLQLNRETIQALDPADLSGVLGGRICVTGGETTSVPSVCGCGATDTCTGGGCTGSCTAGCVTAVDC